MSVTLFWWVIVQAMDKQNSMVRWSVASSRPGWLLTLRAHSPQFSVKFKYPETENLLLYRLLSSVRDGNELLRFYTRLHSQF